METIVKPKRDSVSISGAERLSEMQDLDFTRGDTIDTAKETFAIVVRKHRRGDYALEMIRKVDDEVGFIDGVATMTHRFATRPMVQVYDGNDILTVASVEMNDNLLTIILQDDTIMGEKTVVLS